MVYNTQGNSNKRLHKRTDRTKKSREVKELEKKETRIIYYDTTLWNKIEKTEDTQEVFALLEKFCKEHSINVVSYRVREASIPQFAPQEEQE